jgi:hypothetical protein
MVFIFFLPGPDPPEADILKRSIKNITRFIHNYIRIGSNVKKNSKKVNRNALFCDTSLHFNKFTGIAAGPKRKMLYNREEL